MAEPFTPDELRQKVDDIILTYAHGINESAHEDEDELHKTIIRMFCPEWVKDEIARLTAAPYDRWYD